MNKTYRSQQVLNLPAGYFGMVLGTIGLGFAWRYASTLWPVSRSIGDGLVTLAIAIWVLLSMAFISRAIRFPASVLQEMRHPVSSSFVSLFPATTLLVSIGLAPWCRPLAIGLFVPGVALQLAYAAWQSGGLWRGNHPREATTPGLYLPTVANNFISAMACGALGFTDAGLVFLGAGVFSWLSLEPAILHRLRSAGELPTALRTSLGIQLAPALVACSAWLSPGIFVSRSMLLSGASRSVSLPWPPPACIWARRRRTAFFIIWRCRSLFLAIWSSACCCCAQGCCWSAGNCCYRSTGKHS